MGWSWEISERGSVHPLVPSPAEAFVRGFWYAGDGRAGTCKRISVHLHANLQWPASLIMDGSSTG